MITLIDGPAVTPWYRRHHLNCERTPMFLRVVVDENGTVDALDQLDDAPKSTETIHVYVLAAQPTTFIECTRGKGCRPGVVAEYRHYRTQPTDDIMRDNASWATWCQAEYERRKASESQPRGT